MTFAKLKGRMREKECSQSKLAKKMGITVQALNAKLNGRSQFTVPEAIQVAKILDIDDPREFFLLSRLKNATENKEVTYERISCFKK